MQTLQSFIKSKFGACSVSLDSIKEELISELVRLGEVSKDEAESWINESKEQIEADLNKGWSATDIVKYTYLGEDGETPNSFGTYSDKSELRSALLDVIRFYLDNEDYNYLLKISEDEWNRGISKMPTINWFKDIEDDLPVLKKFNEQELADLAKMTDIAFARVDQLARKKTPRDKLDLENIVQVATTSVLGSFSDKIKPDSVDNFVKSRLSTSSSESEEFGKFMKELNEYVEKNGQLLDKDTYDGEEVASYKVPTEDKKNHFLIYINKDKDLGYDPDPFIDFKVGPDTYDSTPIAYGKNRTLDKVKKEWDDIKSGRADKQYYEFFAGSNMSDKDMDLKSELNGLVGYYESSVEGIPEEDQNSTASEYFYKLLDWAKDADKNPEPGIYDKLIELGIKYDLPTK